MSTRNPYENKIIILTYKQTFVKILSDSEIQNYFNEYINVLERINDYQNRFLSKSGDKDIVNIKNVEMDKLYSRIGNMILKDYKKKNNREINVRDNVDMFKFSNSANENNYYNGAATIDNQDQIFYCNIFNSITLFIVYSY